MADEAQAVQATQAQNLLKVDGKGQGRTHTDGTSLKAPPATDEKKTEDVKTEAKVEDKKTGDTEEKKEQRRAERIARLAREETAIRTERERLKAKEKEIADKEKLFSDRLQRASSAESLDQLVAVARQDTPEGREARQKLLASTGITFTQFARDVAEPKNVNPAAIVQVEIEKFKKELEKRDEEREAKRADEAAKARTAQQISGVKNNLRQIVENSGKTYKLTKLNDASDSAYELMVKQYGLDKTVLSPEAALEKIEKDLERQVRESYKLLNGEQKQEDKKEEKKQEQQGKQVDSLKVKRDTSTRQVGKPDARQESAESYSRYRSNHLNELLAKHRARLNTT